MSKVNAPKCGWIPTGTFFKINSWVVHQKNQAHLIPCPQTSL